MLKILIAFFTDNTSSGYEYSEVAKENVQRTQNLKPDVSPEQYEVSVHSLS